MEAEMVTDFCQTNSDGAIEAMRSTLALALALALVFSHLTFLFGSPSHRELHLQNTPFTSAGCVASAAPHESTNAFLFGPQRRLSLSTPDQHSEYKTHSACIAED
ncbi:hypothetical protein TcWFU_008583 [Taenia crassiceps]|uniref:Uncharacterized protein n=1 Tax=Taenia crassiceps TaxID=6207 RepID=A0ABR4Q2R5_9CEST